ncbi:LysE family transporter [Kocuria palustris]|uniref:LysE family transporter n=1 Tax=Kocuria palustris TaxID=71999 RepID=UPI0036F2C0E0
MAAPNGRSIIRQGATVSALNAKSLVFFVAFLPLFVSPSAALPLWVQLAVLGLTWAAMVAVFNLVLGLASRRLLTGQPTAAGIISRVTGIAMVVMGL